jgi:hypothetical protein
MDDPKRFAICPSPTYAQALLDGTELLLKSLTMGSYPSASNFSMATLAKLSPETPKDLEESSAMVSTGLKDCSRSVDIGGAQRA